MGKRAAGGQNLPQFWAKTQKTPNLRSRILLTRGGSLGGGGSLLGLPLMAGGNIRKNEAMIKPFYPRVQWITRKVLVHFYEQRSRIVDFGNPSVHQ